MADGRAIVDRRSRGAAPTNIERAAPALSVGVPVYNGARWLGETLEALLAQSFKDFEIVISDNASTDDTEAICRQFVERDARVRYFRQPTNIGIYRNHDAVFALSRGRYFKWSAHSDLCARTFLERCVGVLEARPDVVLAYAKTRLLLTDLGDAVWDFDAHPNLDEESAATRALRFLQHPYFPHFNNPFHGVIRATALRQTWLNVPLHGSDLVMVLQLLYIGKFVEVPEYLFFRRYTPETDDTAAAEHGVVSNFGEADAPIDKGARARARFHAHRLVATLAAPIGLAEKRRVLFHLARAMAKTALSLVGLR